MLSGLVRNMTRANYLKRWSLGVTLVLQVLLLCDVLSATVDYDHLIKHKRK
jgi:hypothetical protein